METNAYETGRLEAIEQIVALIYERYLHHRTFHGIDSEQALLLKNTIHSIRDLQAETMNH